MYYPQHNKEHRVFIDKELHRGATAIRELPADTWLDARSQVLDYEFEYRKGWGYVYAD